MTKARTESRAHTSVGEIKRKGIDSVLRTGGAVRQVYEAHGFRPAIAEMQRVPGVSVAMHVATKVIEVATPGSTAADVAQSFLRGF